MVKFFIGINLILAFVYSNAFAHEGECLHGLEFKIVDEHTLEPVEAQVTIFHNSDFEIYKSMPTVEGVAADSTEKHGWFLIEVYSDLYFMHTDTLWITETTEEIIQRQYSLKPIEHGLTFVFNDITFYFNSIYLKPGATEALDSIAQFLHSNPSIAVEVSGHTDDEGPADYNELLSKGRAESIVKVLTTKGVERERLVAKGYGESKPLDLGITKEAKARNRRVELMIIGNDSCEN